MDQEDHPTQDESSVDDSDYSIEYDEDPTPKNEELKAKTNISSNNPVDHKEDTSSSVVYDSDADSKTSEIDMLDLSSENETDMSSMFNHAQNDSESDSEDFDSDTIELGDLTSPTSGHEGHKFIDIPDSAAQLPNPHKITSGQLKGFEISDTVLWTPPSGINPYGALPNQTQSIRRHSVPLTPYVSFMAQVPPEQKDSDSSQVFQVQMGTVEGVVPGTEFSAYAPNNTFLCIFAAQSVKIAQTILVRKATEDAVIPIPHGSCAEVSEWRNEPMILYVYIPDDFRYTTDLFPPTRSRRTRKFAQALSIENAHIIVNSDEDEIIIESQRGTMYKCQTEVHIPLNGHPAHLPDGMDGIAHFNYFLEHSNEVEGHPLKGQFAFEMHRLQGDYPHRKPGRNMVKDGEVRFASNPHAKYGFTIRNTSPVNLFPYLFYFDPDKFTIQVSSAMHLEGMLY